MTASFSTDRSPLSVSARPAPWTGVARDPAAAADLPGVQAQRRTLVICRHVARCVAREFDVAPDALMGSACRRQPLARARQVAMYLAHVLFGLSLEAIARAFGRDRTTVAYACRKIEDWRERAANERCLIRLERACLPERACMAGIAEIAQ